MKQEFGVEVEWKAFELRPGWPAAGSPRELKPGETMELSPSVRQLAEQIGLKMQRPPFIACSRPALEAAEFAKEQGVFDRFHRGVFKAYFEDVKNIGLRPVLREIAASSGLDTDEMERRLDEGKYKDIVDAQNLEAHSLGIGAVPAYIIGKRIIEGAHPYSYFQGAIALARNGE